MQRTLCVRVLAGALSAWAWNAGAQESDGVVVTATPFRSSLFELASPADALSGLRLLWQRKSSIGETLDGMPGVSSTYFGPFVSRPVIRGLDGDRIRILQNGTGTLDASSLSFDHAVPYDPLVAERIEVVRGAAAVLYGGSAVGGVVNVIDNRIPTAPLNGVSGRAEARVGGADRERSLGALLEAGNGSFAIHADVFDRSSKDLSIAGFARSDRQRAVDGPGVAQPEGTLPNSHAKASGGTLGASATWGNGYLGLSYGAYNANYGSPAEAAVRIDMKSERLDLAGEARELGSVITGVKFKLGHSDYRHQEIEAGAVNTTFANRGYDGRLEVSHARLGPLTGAFGLQVTDFHFSALGAEAFVPKTSTNARGLFLYEELPWGKWKFSFGARSDRTRVSSEGGGPVDASTGLPRFDPAQSRKFSTGSGAFGMVYSFDKNLALAANLSSTQRAPTYYELFANGPHVATGSFEVGDSTFGKEKSRSIDLGLRWRAGAHSANVSLYRTQFKNFLAALNTGNTRGGDGELNPVDADGDGVADGSGEDILPEFRYAAVPALFRGIEASARLRVYDRAGTVDLELKGDVVRAYDRSTGQPLPRISPARIGIGLEYGLNRFTARADLVRASAQNRVAANEFPTDGYTLVNLAFGYNFAFEKAALNAFLKINNLFDKEARSHASFLKEIAPLGGRAAQLGLRASF
ncbi:MAG: TonB-dependent receptor [Candidatus Parcubacteria bacterium]|nr:TonB-dependent receptor [Burkholderiales bacterium]